MANDEIETATRSRPSARASTGRLLSDTLDHVTNLVRGEINLARAELQENANRALAGLGMMVAAVVISLTAFNVLSAALVAWLGSMGMGAGWAALIVGGVLILLAVILGMVGKNRLTATSLAPTRTVENLKRDARTVDAAFNDQ